MIEDMIERGLLAVTQLGDDEIAKWHPALFACLPDGEINTSRRIAAFLGQCSHECAGFTVFEENLNYRAERLCAVWPTRFQTVADARPFEHNPEALANKVYAARMGNGPVASGDGWRFRGQGIIQLTGRDNYRRFGAMFGMSADQAATFIATPSGAVASAVWYWTDSRINDAADGWDIDTVTGLINSGMAGQADRRRLCDAALTAIGDTQMEAA